MGNIQLGYAIKTIVSQEKIVKEIAYFSYHDSQRCCKVIYLMHAALIVNAKNAKINLINEYTVHNVLPKDGSCKRLSKDTDI
jgi:hypothetical protein